MDAGADAEAGAECDAPMAQRGGLSSVLRYDHTHIARREAYLKLVFEGPGKLPHGMFIEDHFGQILLQNLIADFDRWFPIYGAYCHCVEGAATSTSFCPAFLCSLSRTPLPPCRTVRTARYFALIGELSVRRCV